MKSSITYNSLINSSNDCNIDGRTFISRSVKNSANSTVEVRDRMVRSSPNSVMETRDHTIRSLPNSAIETRDHTIRGLPKTAIETQDHTIRSLPNSVMQTRDQVDVYQNKLSHKSQELLHLRNSFKSHRHLYNVYNSPHHSSGENDGENLQFLQQQQKQYYQHADTFMNTLGTEGADTFNNTVGTESADTFNNTEDEDSNENDRKMDTSSKHACLSSNSRGAPTKAMYTLSITQQPRKRALSLKRPRKTNMDNTELDEIRPRTSSLPTRNNVRRPDLHYLTPPPNIAHEDVYTIRSFVTTSKGQLVSHGDSVRSRSTNSVMSSGSDSLTELTHLSCGSSLCSLSQGSCGFEPPVPPLPFRVLMLGSPGVGKSSLTEQFSTSEYLGTFGPSIDSYREKNVSVLIDGEESTVDFIDPVEDSELINDLSLDGFVVVFRIDDRRTFSHATDLLYSLRKERGLDSAIIVVANKCDLVRSREVTTEEGKSVAATYDCKYIETSVVLNHNVDELLVGIVTQMRLLSSDRTSTRKSKHGDTQESSCYSRSKHLLSKIFRRDPLSKSCENLYVL